MKANWIGIFLIVSVTVALAQPLPPALDFSNYKPGRVVAPVDVDGVKLGNQFLGQLYAGGDASSLLPIGLPVPFRNEPGTTAGSGYIIGGAVDVQPLLMIYVELRVWAANGGPSYEAAIASGAKAGRSGVFQVDLSTPPGLPAPLIGLQSFSLTPGANTPPIVANPIADFAVSTNAVDTVVDLRAIFADQETPDADLVYTVQANSNLALVVATVDNVTDKLVLHYQANQFGSGTITVRATDAGGLHVEDTFVVTVGHPPVSSGLAATTPQNQPLLLTYASMLSPIFAPDGGLPQIVSVGTTEIRLDGELLGTVELSTNGAVVVADGARAVYIPNQDFVGADRFSYLVSDSWGLESTVFAQIAVLPPGVVANAAQPPVVSGGSVSFSFAGLPGKTYQVQRAESLLGPWIVAGTLTVGPDGTALYVDNSPPVGKGFYRTVLAL